MLRILRNASVHYPLLRRLLKHFYVARNAHLTIDIIDSSLADGDVAQLIDLKINEADENEFDNVYYAINDGEEDDPIRIQNLDTLLYFQYSDAIDEFKKALSDQAVNACCSCERLLRKKSVTEAKNLDSDVWNILLDYIRENDPTALNKVMYICNHCKPIIRRNEVPARCVLNGLKCEPLPKELENLDPLSCQLIQRAKCFQTFVRLGTHTLKVPTYNSLKALKGAMFYLPLPLEKTMETLNEVGIDSNHLPNPELYIIINGQPTKSNNVWRSQVDVNKIKAALRKLKELNWLYRNVDDDSIDESSENVIQVVSNTTCKMLEKANDQDLEGLSAYTIRNLDSKIATGSDISQYKLMNVKEAPIDNRQEHLDLLCFPTLFPTRQYGEHHPRQRYPAQTLSFSEYIKSRLLNKDSRFHKNHSYCLHYYGLKINKALKTGIYNLLKTSRGNVGQTVAEILEKINVLDEEFEGNLSTMLALIRGTNQYWFRVKSEVKSMIAEYGSPTPFLTLSYAEYDSADIAQYLRKVNNAPQSYSISRLCTEDPVSVSRQFSYKFKDFFNIVILQRGVLGKVEQYYVKKEYQMRGAPHYHILLWIENAPVVGIDRPEEVCSFIQDRITCHIPDSNTSPDLNFLVTKYQMHKCSKYCKRNIKVGKTYVSRCRFDFPRPV
uniref:Uncharacterized protein n=1 Tax=Amphimedon queenslandica TaxID=400682 RepID=A0A1X7VCQ4_AMPQE